MMNLLDDLGGEGSIKGREKIGHRTKMAECDCWIFALRQLVKRLEMQLKMSGFCGSGAGLRELKEMVGQWWHSWECQKQCLREK